MAHYALIDEDNIVVNVITGKDEGEDGIDWEDYYGTFTGLTCKRTSYNTHANQHSNGGEPFRKNYAAIGMIWDEARDAFYYPKPFESFALNEETCLWEAPFPMPNDGNLYSWNEEEGAWNVIS
jgi:hypothetical protein